MSDVAPDIVALYYVNEDAYAINQDILTAGKEAGVLREMKVVRVVREFNSTRLTIEVEMPELLEGLVDEDEETET